MKISFADITVSPQRYVLDNLVLDTGDELFDLVGGIDLDCSLVKKGEARVLLQGRVRATVLLDCDRCLKQYQIAVGAPVWMFFEYNDAGSWSAGEIDLQPEDLDVVTLAEPVVDLADAARQQVYLELPMRHLCRASCKGLCPYCGVDLNESTCSCAGATVSNPFAVLAALKK
jgi:uncharacterized protein